MQIDLTAVKELKQALAKMEKQNGSIAFNNSNTINSASCKYNGCSGSCSDSCAGSTKCYSSKS